MKEFMIINDVQQNLNTKIFKNGPWLHLATVTTPSKSFGATFSPFKEYICFKHVSTNKIYIEELDFSSPGILKQIKDDSLFNDLAQFLTQKGILSFGINKEFKVAKKN